MLFDALQGILDKVQKPARYIGGELNSAVKDKESVSVRYAFCFPDMYEIGMSHLGMKILYSLLNAREDTWCERVFAPGADMEGLMRCKGIPLYGLESLEPIRGFDFIGFTLQYEMSFTAVLNMLDLAGLPVRSADREGLSPIVIAGGPCACNPEPMADFIDLFVLGEGEEVSPQLIELYKKAKSGGWEKSRFLSEAVNIPGVYVPSLYTVSYHDDGRIAAVAASDGAPAKVRKRIIADLDGVFFPDKFVVPFVEIVHDRAVLEILRGCIRGCRFCQAGFLYRPYREKSPCVLERGARSLTDSSGYDEISLTSLSTSDYCGLEELLSRLTSWTQEQGIGLSLPSLRMDNFTPELSEQIAKVRKSGLTFAPEAGTQRLRDAINKNITEDDILGACRTAFLGGYTSVKLYFMLGLPTETREDIAGIAELAHKIVDLFYSMPDRPKGKSVNVSISAACFVPKPFTPFQFEAQDTAALFREKQEYLKSCIRSRKVSFRYHEAGTSVLEATLARGDRRLCAVIEGAWKKGSKLDGWSEHFSQARWDEAMAQAGLDCSFYANRKRDYDEIMPWDHLDFGVSKEFLISENRLAYAGETTPSCREGCAGCGSGGGLYCG
ncbi:MAG: TIGR03960 family B12-binding radical SAM protein [Oscillospiraceae bacterium]|nr:TIGR03960 family B12-binding radical SAM protein [Oscillospiraceae bacterium]